MGESCSSWALVDVSWATCWPPWRQVWHPYLMSSWTLQGQLTAHPQNFFAKPQPITEVGCVRVRIRWASLPSCFTLVLQGPPLFSFRELRDRFFMIFIINVFCLWGILGPFYIQEFQKQPDRTPCDLLSVICQSENDFFEDFSCALSQGR